MKGKENKTDWENNLFRTIYCQDCKQVKTCGKLSSEYCCQCSYQNQRENWTEYLTYEKALSYEKHQRKEHERNLQQLAKGKTPEDRTNFTDWKRFYQQKSWGINLEKWLREKRVLPVDSRCAKQWRKDKEHLPEKCGCLERKAQENYLFFTDCLKRDRERLEKECFCEESEKVRVDYIDSQGEGWIYCEICEERIESAGHHGVIKNRNDPRFWGLEVKERVLCGGCLEKRKEKMIAVRRAEFNRYRKKGKL